MSVRRQPNARRPLSEKPSRRQQQAVMDLLRGSKPRSRTTASQGQENAPNATKPKPVRTAIKRKAPSVSSRLTRPTASSARAATVRATARSSARSAAVRRTTTQPPAKRARTTTTGVPSSRVRKPAASTTKASAPSPKEEEEARLASAFSRKMEEMEGVMGKLTSQVGLLANKLTEKEVQASQQIELTQKHIASKEEELNKIKELELARASQDHLLKLQEVKHQHESTLQQTKAEFDQKLVLTEQELNDKLSALTIEFKAARNAHAENIAALKAVHAEEIAESQQRHQQELLQLKENIAKQLDEQNSSHQSEIKNMKDQQRLDLDKATNSLTQKVNELTEVQTGLKEALQAEHNELVKDLQAKHNEILKETKANHLKELEELTESHSGEIETLEAKLKAFHDINKLQLEQIQQKDREIETNQQLINTHTATIKTQKQHIDRLQAEATSTKAIHEAQIAEWTSKTDNLQMQLNAMTTNFEHEQKTCANLREEVSRRDEMIKAHQQTILDIKQELADTTASLKEELQNTIEHHREEMATTKASYEETLATTTKNYETTIANNRLEYETTLSTTTNDYENKIDGHLNTIRVANELTASLEARVAELEATLSQRNDHISYLEEKAKIDECLRRKMHNQIQELKGNIRVVCRVRPLLGKETEGDNHYEFPRVNPQQMIIRNTATKQSLTRRRGSPPTTSTMFNFDRCFGPDSRQSEIFEEISHLVQSSLDGYNCCIFAYGQTGSGKTYTMEGPEQHLKNEQNAGMIQRAVDQVFSHKSKLEEQGWEYDLTASFLEIYNDTLRDLLADKKAASKKLKYEIRHEKTGQTTVSNMTTEDVHSLLQRASALRSTASTNKNDRSSRSHSIFQLHIRGQNQETGESITGLLNLIDLAGSERLGTSSTAPAHHAFSIDASGAEGETKKETIFINSSLSNLSTCIQSLANRSKHVPYRNSKLTYLLQNSLGGNSKTLMFVNISPADCNIKESINSLRFAAKVNSCDIGTAKKTKRVQF